MADFRLGVDVGGTFTDVVLIKSDGTIYPRKVLSTPQDFSVAIKQGVGETLAERGISADQVREYIHGATVATNAIITRTGATTALITTKGFRDVLEIRRMRMPRLYDLNWEKPEPLVPRRLRFEVSARMSPLGEQVDPLDEEAVLNVIQRLLKEGVQSVAVCFLHAYANGAHERRVRDSIKELASNIPVSISSEVLPESQEYERTSTTVINAYVQPSVSRYFLHMERDMKAMGMSIPIMVMQSNGGMMPSELAKERPVHIIESGPAAGVTGSHALANKIGIRDVMTLDMGGTTAKAALIEDGEVSHSPEYEVGGNVSIGHRLIRGSGYLLRVPSVDLAEVGAGGGSVAWVDDSGVLKVGPHSTGAIPGPACYNQGGEEATITDANVYMGLTNPYWLAGGTLKIHPDLAEEAIQKRVATPLGLDLATAAWGIRSVANSSLIRALRAVSTERGRDPRRFALFAFGGMGPVHAADLANELAIEKIIIPPLPGLFSSVGLLCADVEHHLIRTHYAKASDLDYGRANQTLKGLLKEASSTLEQEGFDSAHRSVRLSADTRYAGQDYALTISMRSDFLNTELMDSLVEEFHREHQKTYGYRSDQEEVQITAFRCLGRGISNLQRMPPTLRIADVAGWTIPVEDRKAYFGPELGWITVPIVSRDALSIEPNPGPMIVEEDNSLTVVPPRWTASIDQWSNIVLETF